jgi:hypothetical protein
MYFATPVLHCYDMSHFPTGSLERSSGIDEMDLHATKLLFEGRNSTTCCLDECRSIQTVDSRLSNGLPEIYSQASSLSTLIQKDSNSSTWDDNMRSSLNSENPPPIPSERTTIQTDSTAQTENHTEHLLNREDSQQNHLNTIRTAVVDVVSTYTQY